MLIMTNEDLDSLISITTDEELESMIDEYDRTAIVATSVVKPSCICPFLFPPTNPDSTHSIPPPKFSTPRSNRRTVPNLGFFNSVSINCLVDLDNKVVRNNLELGSKEVGEGDVGVSIGGGTSLGGSFGNNQNLKQDFHSFPDSPMLETTSSSPSLANFPSIRVHVVEDQKVMGIEEQFAQIRKDESLFLLSSLPPPLVSTTLVVVGVQISSLTTVARDYYNWVVSNDERSDHGVPVGYRKPPLLPYKYRRKRSHKHKPLLLSFKRSQSGSSCVVDLPSPYSISSDSSLANTISHQKPIIQSGTTRVLSDPVDLKLNVFYPHGQIQMQQHVQDPGYLLQQQFE
ncbi:hypothetical protein V8G54_030565 [Vigna mungo]|uniref:PB1 domain-containing protein n=1 Tax=Vigna mungo TaxID=3915 RepID=A0AAQ3MXA6_VIGMU